MAGIILAVTQAFIGLNAALGITAITSKAIAIGGLFALAGALAWLTSALMMESPSLLVIEDALDALLWAQSIGGLSALIDRSNSCLEAIKRWVDASPTFGFLAEDPATISNTSVTISIIDPWFSALDGNQKSAFVAALAHRLSAENVGYDLASYRNAPAGLRIWAGPMVDVKDIESLLPWIDWAYAAERTTCL